MWARRLFLRLVVVTGSISCVAILTAWGVSTVREGGVLVRDWHGARLIEVRYGVFYSRYNRTTRYANFPIESFFSPIPFRLAAPWGYNFGKEVKPFRTDFQGIVDFRLPLIVPIVATLAVALLAAGRLRGLSRRGYCRQCGYNLTGNRSGICSECGTRLSSSVHIPPETAKAAATHSPGPPSVNSGSLATRAFDPPRRNWPLRLASAFAILSASAWSIGLTFSFIEHWREMRGRDPEVDALNPPGELEAIRLTKWELRRSGQDAYLDRVEPYVLNGEWHVDCTSQSGDLVTFRQDSGTGRLVQVAGALLATRPGMLSWGSPSPLWTLFQKSFPPLVPQGAQAYPRFQTFLKDMKLSDTVWPITTFVLDDDYYVLCVTRPGPDLPRQTKLYVSRKAKDDFYEMTFTPDILKRAQIEMSPLK